jgi:ATP-dependent Lon protease
MPTPAEGDVKTTTEATPSLLLPVLPLRDVSLFPAASLALVVNRPPLLKVLEVAKRSGGRLLAVSQKDPQAMSAGPRDLQELGTIAEITDDRSVPDGGHRIELDGQRRARVITVLGIDTFVAEVQPIDESDAGDEWGPAVEALARYLHAHAELRSFLDQQRRSKEPMAWVNLACQHLPITASARQKLLECDAPERCLKISRGLDALLRKEKGD